MELRRIFYGYRKDQFDYYIVQGEALVVNKIFRDYLAGHTLLEIAKELTAKQISYYKDKTQWTKNMVCRIIENEHYCGDEEYPRIANNEKWEFVDVYADEGITGTQVKKRDEFLRMIKDCEKGKIDMILTKSVSRFARNIVDSLSFVRKLKAMGIAIYFEEQNINSLKEDSETYIGIYSVMAQSESENISANVKWGISKRMENGTYCSNMNMFGYRRDKTTKEITIVESEAEVVRWIFNLYLDGKSAFQIKQLERNGA